MSEKQASAPGAKRPWVGKGGSDADETATLSELLHNSVASGKQILDSDQLAIEHEARARVRIAEGTAKLHDTVYRGILVIIGVALALVVAIVVAFALFAWYKPEHLANLSIGLVTSTSLVCIFGILNSLLKVFYASPPRPNHSASDMMQQVGELTKLLRKGKDE